VTTARSGAVNSYSPTTSGIGGSARSTPVALLGGETAVLEPWRNTYAHLSAAMGWTEFAENFAALDLYRFLHVKPRDVLDGMLRCRVNAPLASSCGRLFDAVAAAAGIVRERAHYEGHGAVELESSG